MIKFNQERIGSALIIIAMFSTFFPIKIYPILFVLVGLYLLISHPYIYKMQWVLWLSAFIGYALLISYIYSGILLRALSETTSVETEWIIDLSKLVINSFFLMTVINWARATRGSILRKHLDLMLHVTFILILLQLFVYVAHAGTENLGIAKSSNDASSLYDESLCFWGVPDKNIFGAKIAIFGFVYLFNYFVWKRQFPIWRTVLVFLCAFLSNSRTPMAALFIGVVYVLFRHLRLAGRLLVSFAVVAVSPFLVQRILRFDSLFDSSDGFGVRLLYWSTFFANLNHVSVFGNGFMSANKFLNQYSLVELGVPPHLHNLFFNSYLDFGFPGLIFYTAFLVCLYKFCRRDSPVWITWYWTAAFLPLLSIMLTLSSGYESDTAVYFAAVYIIGHCASHKLAAGVSPKNPEFQLRVSTSS